MIFGYILLERFFLLFCKTIYSQVILLNRLKGEVKKDPNGFSYKKITMNIYRELFATKLWDKLWPPNPDSLPITTTTTTNATSSTHNTDAINNNNNNNNGAIITTATNNEIKLDELNVLNLYNTTSNGGMNSSITESIFEKIALMEFEASIYSQLSCSKILAYYFQRIIANEIKSLRNNKASRTILVSPVEKKEASMMMAPGASSSSMAPLPGSNDYFATWTHNSENLKLISKKLSLTISDLG